MKLSIAIAAYAIAMTLANLSAAAFGPAITPVNAFVLIGLDLALRDWLHVRLRTLEMGALIAVTGVLSYILNVDASGIAVASAVSFTLAALADWLVFSKASGSWMRRSMVSNVAGAAVDSVAFPTIAFGALLPEIVALQFVAKVAGGAIWAAILRLRMEAPAA